MIIYDGDPKLYDTGDGANLLITDGQPFMDEGLENAVFISLFSSSNWWGNSVSSKSEKMESIFETVLTRTLTNQTRLDAEEFARAALSWMTSDGVADKITVTATIPSVGFLGLVIKIEQPSKTSTIKYSINWATMAVRVGA